MVAPSGQDELVSRNRLPILQFDLDVAGNKRSCVERVAIASTSWWYYTPVLGLTEHSRDGFHEPSGEGLLSATGARPGCGALPPVLVPLLLALDELGPEQGQVLLQLGALGAGATYKIRMYSTCNKS